MTKHFKMEYLPEFDMDVVIHFTETSAPDWLTSVNTVVGSTMDQRWFWKEHVLTLEVGQHVDTDFRRITRVPPPPVEPIGIKHIKDGL
ncbi:hypothetical protein GR11A_00102 [Vibrio phage vB_VcorM_GR11A]|nr:hypothetical protein GR11A_00102 [Vibrio phage vB_VcorM_GR11A]